jgi:pimeloyl-ACP methyl ester carboxylesterase
VLDVGGFWNYQPLPEVDPVNYVTRVRTPVLMLNGRHDVVFPYETMQVPFFQMLGTPAADKQHVAYPTAHSVPRDEAAKMTRGWFDRYLGTPQPSPAEGRVP